MFPDNLADHVDNPGDFNEPDIVAALHRTFSREQVLLNPVRADNGREFVDVLVTTTKTLLLIQAKDSPGTESALTRNLHRKRATASKHVSNAVGQLKGSINHLKSNEAIEVIADGQRRSISLSGRDVFGMVIVKEVFDPDRPDCSPPVLTVSKETGIPCLLLDHSEFQQLTFFQSTEEILVRSLREIFTSLISAGCSHEADLACAWVNLWCTSPVLTARSATRLPMNRRGLSGMGSQGAAGSVSGSAVTTGTPGTEFQEGVEATGSL